MRSEGVVVAADAVDHLQRLALQLEAHAFQAEVESRGGPSPRLHVINPVAPARTEDVFAAHEEDGEWWFWLSWAGRIGPAEDVATAAERVASVMHVIRHPER
ncbi:hypothetical protein C1I98_05380 [Spongiactinospora gelatinilytica]|uniref:Uncharacterized protein n=1 Tax=Spongiactinospora gelatinilytica TaxID=2666298 RepID=A0A2W2HG12_9ACTN|nr:hypothetical protein [Spongiactinospora gelatinilytica]PZG53919.1 hypothetical protein C1I98_05380 [Spongiactinospora gelatinilytica]